MRALLAVPFCVVSLVFSAAAAAKGPKRGGDKAPTFTPLVDLGALPGLSSSDATGINDDGLIIGVSGADAVVWTPDADSPTGYAIHALAKNPTGEPPGTVGFSPRTNGVNRWGQIVGLLPSLIGGMNPPRPRAVVWDAWDQAPRSLGVVAGGLASQGRAINDSGHVAGSSGGPGGIFMVVWRGAGAEVLPDWGANAGAVHGINNAGQICGVLAKYAGGPWVPVVWLPRDDGGYELVELANLGGTPDGAFDIARAINDLGQVVGGSGTITGELTPDGFYWVGESVRPFVWDLVDDDVTRLRPGPTSFPSAFEPAPAPEIWEVARLHGVANDTNERSEIVGYIGVNGLLDAGLDELVDFRTGAYWRNGGKDPVLLGTLGGAHSFPRAINNHGTIVGISDTADGGGRAFVTYKR